MKIVLDDSWALWHFVFVRNNRDDKRNDNDANMKTTLAKKIATKNVKPKATISESDLQECKKELEEIHASQAELREKELKIREYLADLLHDGLEGSKTLTVVTTKVTVTRILNRTITRDEAARMQEEKPDLYATCLNFRPEVRAGEAKKHPEIEEYISTRPGPPTIEFK